MKSLIKKLLTGLITTVILINPLQLRAQEQTGPSSLVNDSLGDLYVVLGATAVGAVLGLSTLSFAETPKDHMKNVAIGGAIGLVFGVGLVVYNQATISSAVISNAPKEMTPDTSEGLARLDFSQQKIAENFMMQPTFAYSFTF